VQSLLADKNFLMHVLMDKNGILKSRPIALNSIHLYFDLIDVSTLLFKEVGINVMLNP
jgi:hypothetical protein